MKVAYVGFGVLGKQIQRFIDEFEKPEQSIFFDDFLFEKKAEHSHPFKNYAAEEFKDYSFYICLGYRHLELKNSVITELLQKGRSLPSFIHPTVYVAPSCKIEAACVLYPNSTIDMEVTLEQGVLLNNAVVISHNTVIGSCSYLSPGIVISGNVTIGKNTFIGSGSVFSNNLSIGENSVIGVGSVLTHSIPNNSNGIGNPFRILNRKLNL